MRAYLIKVDDGEIVNLIEAGPEFIPEKGFYLLSAEDVFANPGDTYKDSKVIKKAIESIHPTENELLRAQIEELQEQIKRLDPTFESKVSVDAAGE